MLCHVTGANGRVGLEVTQALEKLGVVHGTDVDDMDVTDISSIESVFRKNPPNVVVHLAGLKGNIPSQENPMKFFNVNEAGSH